MAISLANVGQQNILAQLLQKSSLPTQDGAIIVRPPSRTQVVAAGGSSQLPPALLAFLTRDSGQLATAGTSAAASVVQASSITAAAPSVTPITSTAASS